MTVSTMLSCEFHSAFATEMGWVCGASAGHLYNPELALVNVTCSTRTKLVCHTHVPYQHPAIGQATFLPENADWEHGTVRQERCKHKLCSDTQVRNCF
ncbi:hypothetical protein PILCRDRAFT_554161 [Piloderma croceum F 1598]|uniref:Uncharacterized protein n=1 Tax=Piloderma croceum (strain F 1598) TaxID=765440 RepID=A0A0C3B0H3_PILCF|nr:hypothetical protein PILCRDRAFT_554161 [Piloderma croceum F 1598]